MRVGVLGLGEAGSLIAADLARAGDEVHVCDPAPVPTLRLMRGVAWPGQTHLDLAGLRSQSQVSPVHPSRS